MSGFKDKENPEHWLRTSAIMHLKRETTPKKKWWVPVWNGLVMDESGVHFKKMGTAVWLFLYFLLSADRRTGTLVRKVKSISSDMGVPRRTVFRWLTVLRTEGYIKTRNSGRYLEIVVNLWKTFGEVQEPAQERCKIRHGRNAKSGTPQRPQNTKDTANFEAKRSDDCPTNDIVLTKLKNDIDIDDPCKVFDFSALRTKEEVLASDLAQGLADLPGFPLYLTLARKYPESLLRAVLGMVQEIPAHKIQKSRGALFNHLIQKHASKSINHPGR